jgi:uncharacterized protein
MKLHLNTTPGNRIVSHAPGEVVVNQTRYTTSLVVTPQRIIADWPPQCFADLQAAHFEILAGLKPEVVVLGTGQRLRFPAPALTASLVNAGIGLEVMDTAAACRTYNILMGDGRLIAAAIMMDGAD